MPLCVRSVYSKMRGKTERLIQFSRRSKAREKHRNEIGIVTRVYTVRLFAHRVGDKNPILEIHFFHPVLSSRAYDTPLDHSSSSVGKTVFIVSSATKKMTGPRFLWSE